MLVGCGLDAFPRKSRKYRSCPAARPRLDDFHANPFLDCRRHCIGGGMGLPAWQTCLVEVNAHIVVGDESLCVSNLLPSAGKLPWIGSMLGQPGRHVWHLL